MCQPLPGSARNFFQLARAARKVAVIDLGFLGDTVHTLPALRALRDFWPRAELQVITAAHVVELLRLCPWIDRARGYPRFPKSPPLWQSLPLLLELRREKFDVTISFAAQDRAAWLTLATGAPLRLGRVPFYPRHPHRQRPPLHWRCCFNHRAESPHRGMSAWRLHLRFLQNAGLAVSAARRFDVTVPADVERRVDQLLGGQRGFMHLSPFTTADRREPQPTRLAAFLNQFHRQRPDTPLVISTAPTAREAEKTRRLLALLDFTPWKIFAGELDVAELAAVIARAKLHVGGDSGGIHVAQMMNTPVVCWFHATLTDSAFLPDGPQDRVIFAADGDDGFLDVSPNILLENLPP
jgi:heptosyltransferase-3